MPRSPSPGRFVSLLALFVCGSSLKIEGECEDGEITSTIRIISAKDVEVINDAQPWSPTVGAVVETDGTILLRALNLHAELTDTQLMWSNEHVWKRRSTAREAGPSAPTHPRRAFVRYVSRPEQTSNFTPRWNSPCSFGWSFGCSRIMRWIRRCDRFRAACRSNRGGVLSLPCSLDLSPCALASVN